LTTGIRVDKFSAMKLRDHPLMIRKSGVPSWPPAWRTVGSNAHAGSSLELGILQDASMSDLIANKIFIAIEHLSERYIAVLAFDDEIFAKQLYTLLLKNIGRNIREIGDLDISHLL
jgi:hypothetical protein